MSRQYTDRQRNLLSDVISAGKYLQTHASGDRVSTRALLDHAGIKNDGQLWSVVEAIKDHKTPEALQKLREVREIMKAVSRVPSYLENIPHPRNESRPSEGVSPVLPVATLTLPVSDLDAGQQAWNVCYAALKGLTTKDQQRDIIRSVTHALGVYSE